MAENQFDKGFVVGFSGDSVAGDGPFMDEPSNIEASFVVYAGRLKPVPLPLNDVPVGNIRSGHGNPVVWEFRDGVWRVAEYHGD